MRQGVSPQQWAVGCILIALVLIGLWPAPSFAQQRGQSPLLDQGTEQARWEMPGGGSSGLSVPLEGQVNPEEYVVGPGDVFGVFVGGPQPVSLTPTVSAGGDLLLPEVGSLPAAGHTLAEVNRAAQSALRQRFQNVSLDVSLQRPRTFYVHVAGAVPTSGRYVANAVTRVSEVVERAFSDTTNAPVANPAFEPSLRGIKVIRQDGANESVDLKRYFSTGDTEYNPYLRDGDVVSVPAYEPKTQSVRVDGAVPFAGSYAYRPGDTVLDLLAIATGQSPPEGVERVRLTRYRSGAPTDTMMLNVAAMVSGNREAVPLRPLDHLSVPETDLSNGTATVEGWVQYPGTYPINLERTTVEDLVKRAGGLRNEALARGAYLLRGRTDAEQARLQRRLTRTASHQALPASAPPDRHSSSRKNFFPETRLAVIPFAERQYLSRELSSNRVSVNLADGKEDAAPVYLRNGDRLVVPRDYDAVFVTGQVNRPGYVPIQPGSEAHAYFAAVGGRTELATQAYVIKAGTQRYVPLQEAEIESGDVIFVNRRNGLATSVESQRLALQEEQSRRDVRFRTVQTILSTVGTAVSIVTTAILIARN